MKKPRNKRHDTNPMSEYLYQLQLIVNNTEFMNKEEANEYETPEMRIDGITYINAFLERDSFESYQYHQKTIFEFALKYGFNNDQAMEFIKNPLIIPLEIREELLKIERERIISSYKEKNRYYLRLAGMPFLGDQDNLPEKVIMLPDEFYKIYENDYVLTRNMPVHEMPKKYLELFINSEYYQKLIKENPNCQYIHYIGSRSIPYHITRQAQDGDILRICMDKLTAIHPKMGNISVPTNIVHEFTRCYTETRDYIYNHLRGNFSSIFPNYTSFIRFLTIYMAIGQTLNELQKKSSQFIHMNKMTANDFFMLYGLPSVIMQGPDRENFLRQIRLLLTDKATNIVYRVKDLIGYEYTDIYTMVMVKQQHYKDGIPLYYRDENGEMQPCYDIFFRRLGTTNDNTSYFQFREQHRNYTVPEITGDDPRWWNSPEVDYAINEMNYTLSNSKYIMLSTHISMTDIWWECCVLLRTLLDLKIETQYTMIQLNQSINNLAEISVFESVLILNVLMNWFTTTANGNTMNGNLYIQNSQLLREGDVAYDYIYPIAKARFQEEYPRHRRKELNERGEIVWRETEDEYEDRWLAHKHIFFRQVSKEIGVNNVCLDLLYNSLNNDGSPKNLVLGWPYKLSAFNWHVREEYGPWYNRILPTLEYIKPKIFIPMVEDVLNRNVDNLGEVMMNNAKEIYAYLEDKLHSTRTIDDFRQVTTVYKHLFLIEPIREDWYKDITFDIDEILIEKWQLTKNELHGLKSFFRLNDMDSKLNTHLTVNWVGESYKINLHQVLNTNTAEYEINGCHPFLYPEFREAFQYSMEVRNNSDIKSSRLPPPVSGNFILIIMDKIELDVGNTAYGPKTFESMLFQYNPSMYAHLKDLRKKPSDMVTTMRTIIKSLEYWSNYRLNALTFSALGEDEYFSILKDVISYFKSYMVEFTKSEFIYLFNGLWDQGGHSNMLRLHDAIVQSDVTFLPKDSIGLYDISHQTHEIMMMDSGRINRNYKEDGSSVNVHVTQDQNLFHDSMSVQYEMTYEDILKTDYEILYEDGKRLSKTPFHIDPMEKVLFIIRKHECTDKCNTECQYEYSIILNINNLSSRYPANYVGTVLP